MNATATEFKAAADRYSELHDTIKATYSDDIFKLAFAYAEAGRADVEALRDREGVRVVHRLAEHFPGLAPAIVCVAESIVQIEMGHATREKFGTADDPRTARSRKSNP